MLQKTIEPIKEFLCRDNGAIAILAALVFPVMLGFAALAVEYGTTLTKKAHNQRVSDLAAFAAAFEYQSVSGDVKDRVASARTAGGQLASLNGVATGVTVSFDDESEPSWVQVDIVETQQIYLSRLLRPNDSATIETRARVALGDSSIPTPCILTESGITINGAVAPEFDVETCSLASNTAITVNGGNGLNANCIAPSINNAGCVEETVSSNTIPNPFLGNLNLPADCDERGELESLVSNVVQDGKGKDKETIYTLKPGTLCVDANDIPSGGYSDTFKSASGKSNTIIFLPGQNANKNKVTIKGSGKFDINVPTTGNLQGAGVLGSDFELVIQGGGTLLFGGSACYGLVLDRLRINGTVTISADCPPEDDQFGSPIKGDPRLVL